MMRWSLALLVLAGCAAKHAVAPPPAPPAVEAPPRVPSDQLARDARYVDLVRAAAELEATPRGGGCLLSRHSAGFQLRAELAPALRPLPLPADDLDALLKGADRVDLLSAWGRHGDGSGKLALAAFTLAGPTREGVALLLTDRGFSVRGASGTGVVPRDGLDSPQAIAALAQLPEAVVFVAAEAAMPVARIAELLSALGVARREVVLAVNLGADTALPRPPARPPVARCPDGLPSTDQPEGSLSAAALAAGVAPLREQAPDCLGRGDARGAAGGKLSLGLRIAASGRVQEACLVRDELEDDGVAGCVIELARGLAFPAPEPGGVIDIELPIALRPGPRVTTPPLCAE